jgi:hypothetical protein
MDEQLLFFLLTLAFVIIVFISVNKFYLGIKVISVVSITLLIFSVLHREFKEFKKNNPAVVAKVGNFTSKFTSIFGKKKEVNGNIVIEPTKGLESDLVYTGLTVTKPVSTSEFSEDEMSGGRANEPFCAQPYEYATCQIERPVPPNPYCPEAGPRARENLRLVPQRPVMPKTHSLDDKMAHQLRLRERTVEGINRHINGNKYRKEKYINDEMEYAERTLWWEDPKYNDMRPDYRIAETIPRRDTCTMPGQPSPHGLHWPTNSSTMNNHQGFDKRRY